MTCKVCLRSDRAAIEKRLSADTDIPAIAEELGIPATYLRAHVRCMRKEIKEAAEARGIDLGGSVLEEYERIFIGIRNIERRAKKYGDDRLKLQALQSQQRVLSDVARLTGKYMPDDRQRAKERGYSTLREMAERQRNNTLQ